MLETSASRDTYCDFHKSNGHATINSETMRKDLAEKYTKGELKDIDLGPHPKKNFTPEVKVTPHQRKEDRMRKSPQVHRSKTNKESTSL